MGRPDTYTRAELLEALDARYKELCAEETACRDPDSLAEIIGAKQEVYKWEQSIKAGLPLGKAGN